MTTWTVLTPTKALGCALLLLAALVLAALVLQLRHAGAELDRLQASPPPHRHVVLLSSYASNDAARYQQAFADFERRTGIEVTVRAAGGDFANRVYVATPGFDAPDIALFAQPGLFRELVRSGHVQPLPADLAMAVAQDFPSFLDPLLRDGDRYHGVWARVAIKSLVWYRRALFEREGFEVPRTAQALDVLAERMRARGLVPWCIGVAARSATGWVATDWVENFLLQDAGPQAYDAWVAQALPFDSPPVRQALARWERLVRTPGMVDGGPQGVLSTSVAEAARRFASEPAPCLMMRNAEWVASEFPPSMRVAPDGDIDFFVLPGRTAGRDELLVAGDIAGALNAHPDTLAVLRYLASADFGRRRAAAGAYLSAHRGVEPSSYGDPLSARLAVAWRGAAQMRMDASDLMPAALGTAAFWAGMVAHLKGRPAALVAAEIDAEGRRVQVPPPAAGAPAAPRRGPP